MTNVKCMVEKNVLYFTNVKNGARRGATIADAPATNDEYRNRTTFVKDSTGPHL